MNWLLKQRGWLVIAALAVGGYTFGALGAILFGGGVLALYRWRRLQLGAGLTAVAALFVLSMIIKGEKPSHELASPGLVSSAEQFDTTGVPEKSSAGEPVSDENNVPSSNVRAIAIAYGNAIEIDSQACLRTGGTPPYCIVKTAPPRCAAQSLAFASDSRESDAYSQCIASCAMAVAKNDSPEGCIRNPQ